MASDTDPIAWPEDSGSYGPAFWARRAAELARENAALQNQLAQRDAEIAALRVALSKNYGAIVNWDEGCSGVAPAPSAEKYEAFG